MKKISLLLVLVLSVIFCFTGCTNEEKEKAIAGFNEAVSTVEKNNSDIQTSISGLQALVDSETPPLDAATIDNATTVIAEAKNKIVEIPEIPSKTEEIISTTENLLKSSDCIEILSKLQSANDALSKSIQQMQQVTNPKESFIVERLTGLPNISGMEAVTEDNDPNGNLNKQGGYTATVYFASDLIDQSEVYGNTIVEKGTEAGGAIEVYSTVEDANKRNEYLAVFDGAGILSSGSHSVVGTIVIRTSDKLTASQQKEMEKNIYNSLIEIK